jgi:hypothetical protein
VHPNEEVYLRVYTNVAEACAPLGKYPNLFNVLRPHSSFDARRRITPTSTTNRCPQQHDFAAVETNRRVIHLIGLRGFDPEKPGFGPNAV